jgi:hypothetical protein
VPAQQRIAVQGHLRGHIASVTHILD